MGGLTVTFRRREARYFPAGELIHTDESISNFDELEDRLLVDHPRMRRIVLRVSPTWPLACFYLHWSDGADLNALDDRVASGSAADGVFAGAVVGEALGMHHRACGAALRVVALDSVLPLFTNDVERSRAHVYQAACPACGEPWSASVLEFIGTT